jgi:ATP-dependent exoDNAse (exonuclease V) beta subunit
MPSKYAKQEWERQQEKNIEYVAYTRAKNDLYFINRVMPPSYAKKEWGKQQEKNIEYVAYTRATVDIY